MTKDNVTDKRKGPRSYEGDKKINDLKHRKGAPAKKNEQNIGRRPKDKSSSVEQNKKNNDIKRKAPGDNNKGSKKSLKEQLVNDLNRTVPPRIKW